MRAVGIQLDRVAKLLYPVYKAEDIFVQGGFSSCDADPLQNALAFFQNFKHILRGNDRLFSG